MDLIVEFLSVIYLLQFLLNVIGSTTFPLHHPPLGGGVGVDECQG